MTHEAELSKDAQLVVAEEEAVAARDALSVAVGRGRAALAAVAALKGSSVTARTFLPQNDVLLDLRRQGVSCEQIADTYGVTRGVVYQQLRDHFSAQRSGRAPRSR